MNSGYFGTIKLCSYERESAIESSFPEGCVLNVPAFCKFCRASVILFLKETFILPDATALLKQRQINLIKKHLIITLCSNMWHSSSNSYNLGVETSLFHMKQLE